MNLKDLIKKIAEPEVDTPYTDPYGSDTIDGDGIVDDGIGDDIYGNDTAAAPVDNFAPARSTGVRISGNAVELKVVKPESYKNASQIADHLLNGRTVVLNLENTNKETARRLIDFLTGAAYAIGGDIKKVSNNTYVVTPGDSVAVSGDQFKNDAAQDDADVAGDDSSEYYEL